MSISSKIKSVFRKINPRLYHWLQHRVGHPARYKRAADVVERQTGRVVQSGPFKGMKLASTITGSYVPKILGCYEEELHSIVEEIVALEPSLIVDVGCGEGYYLVGLARRLPDTKFLGYDIDDAARTACGIQAAINQVAERIETEGRCDFEKLRTLSLKSSLLIVDCEGFEMELLDPIAVPGLKEAFILVELHELFAPGVTNIVNDRFRSSHEIILIDSLARDPVKYPLLDGLPKSEAQMVVNESRYDKMQWAWMRPLARS